MIHVFSEIDLGPGSTGYRFEIVRQPEDKEIYQAGLELERSLSVLPGIEITGMECTTKEAVSPTSDLRG